AVYGLDLKGRNAKESLSDFISEAVGGEAVVGDYTEWQGLTWVVVEMENDKVSKVGLRFPDTKDAAI
ncbi:MAG: K+/H+ antiporter, partial [Gammaproteobacteria bacterium]|nr:K+/H+ antiporter [Gammaproteobacteria bacterium]